MNMNNDGFYIGHWKVEGVTVYSVARLCQEDRSYLIYENDNELYTKHVDTHFGNGALFLDFKDAVNYANDLDYKNPSEYGVTDIGRFLCGAPARVFNLVVDAQNVNKLKPINKDYYFLVQMNDSPLFNTEAEAVKAAEKMAANANSNYFIVKAVGLVRQVKSCVFDKY